MPRGLSRRCFAFCCKFSNFPVGHTYATRTASPGVGNYVRRGLPFPHVKCSTPKLAVTDCVAVSGVNTDRIQPRPPQRIEAVVKIFIKRTHEEVETDAQRLGFRWGKWSTKWDKILHGIVAQHRQREYFLGEAGKNQN